MEDWTEVVYRADGIQLQEMLEALLERYAAVYPQWEMQVFSIEKSLDRDAQLDRMIALLKSMKAANTEPKCPPQP